MEKCYAENRYGGNITVSLDVSRANQKIINNKEYIGESLSSMKGQNSEDFQKELEDAMRDLLIQLVPDIIEAINGAQNGNKPK